MHLATPPFPLKATGDTVVNRQWLGGTIGRWHITTFFFFWTTLSIVSPGFLFAVFVPFLCLYLRSACSMAGDRHSSVALFRLSRLLFSSSDIRRTGRWSRMQGWTGGREKESKEWLWSEAILVAPSLASAYGGVEQIPRFRAELDKLWLMSWERSRSPWPPQPDHVCLTFP